VKITRDPARLARDLATLRRRRPKFFCLNDDQGDHPNPACLAAVRTLLAEFYPHPGPFETPATPPAATP
jgi:hypothetical protein